MAVAAIYPIITDVVLMAEGHRLAARNADLRYVGRFIDCRQSGHQGDQQDDAAENADFGKGIGTGMEYLAHSSSIDGKSAVGLREIKFADCDLSAKSLFLRIAISRVLLGSGSSRHSATKLVSSKQQWQCQVYRPDGGLL